MAIDYSKRPSTPPPSTPPPSGPVAGGKVSLTKSAPTVSLTKQGSASGQMRVNLNWNALPEGKGKGGMFRRPKQLDLDLGCLYEFTDGTKGVVQALGNSFTAQLREAPHPRVIWLDADDRSGTSTEGENLHIDLGHADKIKRVLVFALIYEGAANWAAADGVVTLFPASGPQIEVKLDDPRDGTRICAIAMLESSGGDLSVRREVNYLNGGQRLLDETYGWGMNWTAGRK